MGKKLDVIKTVRDMESKYGSVLNAPEEETDFLSGVASGARFLAYVVGDKYVSTKGSTKHPRLTVQRSKAYHIETDDDGEDLLPYIQAVYPEAQIKYV